MFLSSVALPLDRLREAIDLLQGVHAQIRPAAIFALRFVRSSPGLLAFTRYEQTCVIDLDGVDSDRTLNFLSAAWDALEASDIPHTHHWGKLNRVTTATLAQNYGSAASDWRSARDAALPQDIQRTFANAFSDAAGLTE